MTSLAGCLIIKNGTKFDYPFQQAIESVLPICDEFVVVEGVGEDDTYERLLAMREKDQKIQVVRSKMERKVSELSRATDLSISLTKCDYYLQIQGDEGINEFSCRRIRSVVDRGGFDILQTRIFHFWSSFDTVYIPKVFYDYVWRVARRSLFPQLHSIGDAMNLGPLSLPGLRTLALPETEAYWLHYGFVRNPKQMVEKCYEFFPWWSQDPEKWEEHGMDPYLARARQNKKVVWTEKHHPRQLTPFRGVHPKSYESWISKRREIVASGEFGDIS